MGVGADDLHGGTGVDLLSYNERTKPIGLSLDDLPGDGSTGKNDNVHGDIETIIATTLADRLSGSDLGQDLYGNAGNDTIDGRGGDDLLNGGTGDDVIRGGNGDDAVQGSAGGDFIDGGPGRDLFEGDNECTALPCTGGADQILARDNEEDTVNCGVGADRATVDLLNIVATDSQQGCESIDRAALPVAAPFRRAAGDRRGHAHHEDPRLARHPHAGGQGGPGRGGLPHRLSHPRAPDPARDDRRSRAAERGSRGRRTRLRLKADRNATTRSFKRRGRGRMTLVIDVDGSTGAGTTLSKSMRVLVAEDRRRRNDEAILTPGAVGRFRPCWPARRRRAARPGVVARHPRGQRLRGYAGRDGGLRGAHGSAALGPRPRPAVQSASVVKALLLVAYLRQPACARGRCGPTSAGC